MAFPPIKINLSSGSDAYLRPALIKFYELEKERINRGTSVERRVIPLGGAIMAFLFSMDTGSKVILFGGLNNILFSGPESSYGFMWDNCSVSEIGFGVGTELLIGGAEDRIYDGEGTLINSSSALSTRSTVLERPSAFVKVNREMFWIGADGSVAIERNGARLDIATVDFSQALLSPPDLGLFPVSSGALIYVPTIFSGTGASPFLWNYLHTINHYVISPVTLAAFTSSYWVPSIFYAQAGNGQYFNGYHYGMFGDWWETAPEDPHGHGLKSISVVFGNLIENRDIGASKRYGYSEIVMSMNDHPTFLFVLFMSELPIPFHPNVTSVYLSMTGWKYGGTVQGGFLYETRLDLNSFFTQPRLEGDPFPEVHTWSFDSRDNASDLTLDIDAIGIVISWKGYAVGYRYKGYLKKIFETREYHSHSVSYDGNIVSLFEGTGEAIETVSVWDMFEPTELDPICDKSVLPEGITVGEIIPVESLGDPDPIKTVPYDGIVNSVEGDMSIWYPAYANVSFPHTGNGTVIIDKLVIRGRMAQISKTKDKCMQSKIFSVRTSGEEENPIVDITVSGVNFKGRFREAAAALPQVLFSSIRVGPGTLNEICFAVFYSVDGKDGQGPQLRITKPPVTFTDSCFSVTRTLEEHLTIGRVVGGGFAVEGALGDLIYGGCLDTYGEEDHECVKRARCNGTVPYSARSSCGQNGLYEEDNPYDPMYISGPKDIIVGSEYKVTGGGSDFVWSISTGAFIDDGRKIVITERGCGEITIKCMDHCGTTAVLEVRGLGQWVHKASNKLQYWYADPSYFVGSWVHQTIYSGGTKTVTTWKYGGIWSHPGTPGLYFCSNSDPRFGSMGLKSRPDYWGQTNPYPAFAEGTYETEGSCGQALTCDHTYGICWWAHMVVHSGFKAYGPFIEHIYRWECP